MVNCAIVGFGYMGEIRKKTLERKKDSKIIGIADASFFKQTKKENNILYVNSYQDLVLKDDIDAIIICVPNNLIPQIAVESINRGKHVFCEKPPGRTVEDIEKMRIAESNNSDIKLMFGFNHRFHPAIQDAKEIVTSNKLGKILWIKGTYGKSGGNKYQKSWRNDPEISGGGILLDQGIHMIDLFRFFCGDFNRVKAFKGVSYWNIPVEDNAFVLLKNDHGQQALLHSSATLWKHTFKLEIGLEKGYLIIEGLLSKTGSYGRESLTIGYQQFEDESKAVGNPKEEKYYYDKDLSWDIEIDNFIQCIQNNAAVGQCSSYDALRAMQIVCDAYKDSKI